MFPHPPRTPADDVARAAPMLSEGLPIRRVGAVSQVEVLLNSDKTLPGMGLQPLAMSSEAVLPLQFSAAPGWQLAHQCPSSGAWVRWNWEYKSWFDNGSGLSTYDLRDERLLDALASVFSRIEPCREETSTGVYYEYHVMPQTKNTSPTDFVAVTPGLHFYKNASGTAQFLALVDIDYSDDGGDAEGMETVNVYEIAQVEVANEEELRRQLARARQAAIHQNRELWG